MLSMWKNRGLSTVLWLNFMRAAVVVLFVFVSVFFLLPHTDVNHVHQQKMTIFFELQCYRRLYTVRIKEPTSECWRRLVLRDSIKKGS